MLIECRSCKEHVSFEAQACPQCGVPTPCSAVLAARLTKRIGCLLAVVLTITLLMTQKYVEGPAWIYVAALLVAMIAYAKTADHFRDRITKLYES